MYLDIHNVNRTFDFMDGISWEQFLCDIKNIHDISQQLNDGWEMISNVRLEIIFVKICKELFEIDKFFICFYCF